ncbi:MAG: DNA-3-methyladenine glycosylase [Deltaproteobacteria bacterium]|nr:DNA-3-methyladenine glycosylase [Deltaproteobacteria bacterium]
MSRQRLTELRAARLTSSFFARDVITVARALIGSVLVHGPRAGIIVETEAYLGPEDLASHARFGPTARTDVMFGPGGISYVYLCYGVHEMFNIVTGAAGQGQAVLIRAIAPYLGLPDDASVGRGPGKLTRALEIDRGHDRRELARGTLYVASGPARSALAGLSAWANVPPLAIATGPRVGVAFAGDWAARPMRFWWRDHPAVSRGPGGSAGQSSLRGAVVAGASRSTRRRR